MVIEECQELELEWRFPSPAEEANEWWLRRAQACSRYFSREAAAEYKPFHQIRRYMFTRSAREEKSAATRTIFWVIKQRYFQHRPQFENINHKSTLVSK